MQKYFDFKEKINPKELEEAAEIIKHGGVVVFPTETVYGIGTNGLNENAIKKIFKIKNRPLNKPISLLVSNIEMINDYTTNITDLEYKIIKNFFPGPLTIVLKKKNIIPNILTSQGDTVGIRVPDSEIARKIIDLVGVPIATSSANISGNTSEIDVQSVIDDLGEKVDCYIDGGKSKIGMGSTVIEVVNSEIQVLREGSITKQEIINKLFNNN